MMKEIVNIKPEILRWAIERAGLDYDDFLEESPKIQSWVDGSKKPTVKQLEDFSKKVHIPFGYLFVQEPIEEKLDIPFFRTNSNNKDKVSLNVYDTVISLQQRQDWLKDYLLEELGVNKLDFVGKFNINSDYKLIVKDIRQTLGLEEHWASEQVTWENSINFLTDKIEEIGIIVTFNGVVENNTHRKLSVDECRGFVLVDEVVPFLFVNNSDSKAAQVFTMLHELAHVWIGVSAGFNNEELTPFDNEVERLCDLVAAEFLVPEESFINNWEPSFTGNFRILSKFYKVSELVIARRALDLKKISKKEFSEFYRIYLDREFNKPKTSGGDFYSTTKKRLSVTLAHYIKNAVRAGFLSHRDAYKLTGLKGDTFHKFMFKEL